MKDDLLQKAKIEAAKNKISLTAYIEEAIEQKLYSTETLGEVVNDFQIITYGNGGVLPGVDLDDSSDLLDQMEG